MLWLEGRGVVILPQSKCRSSRLILRASAAQHNLLAPAPGPNCPPLPSPARSARTRGFGGLQTPLEAPPALLLENTMSKIVSLVASLRDRAGKGAARAVRREGHVPAVVYGGKQDPASISIEERVLVKQLSTGKFLSTLFMIEAGGKTVRVIPRDVQYHPVNDRPLHVDFLRLLEGSVISVEVPVHFTNEEESPGLKKGGTLNVVRHTIELNVPVDSIPEFLEADLTGLELGEGIHISSITLPEGVAPTITDRDFTIATVAAPSALLSAGAEEDEEAAEGEEGEEGVEGEEGAEGESEDGDKKSKD